MNDPVIVCPFVHDGDVAEVRRAFRLDERAGRALPFFFWKDERMIGPERAFEHCWSQFPERDVIIIHTDMAPMPGDDTNQWYGELLGHVASMPGAGMIACDLLYPVKAPDGSWFVQCAGGYFRDGKIGYIGGGVDVGNGTVAGTARPYDDELKKVRRVGWVTFGGVYIRREVIARCGPFDRRYEWAYAMDADYSLEARLRGYDLYQVPVNLSHTECRTTRPLMSDPARVGQVHENFRLFHEKWAWWLERTGTTFDE